MELDPSYIISVELRREQGLNCSSHVIALDRTQDNGCEIHNMACAVNGVSIRLRIASRQTSKQDTTMVKTVEVTTFHTAEILKRTLLVVIFLSSSTFG